MGGAGGTPDLKNPAGIGGSRAGLEGNDASNFNLPGWAAGDTFESWLTRLPGGGAPSAGVGEPMATASNPGANAAPEPSTLASLGTPGAGAPPPVYSMGAGDRTEAAARAGQYNTIQGPGISGAGGQPGKTAEQLAAEQKAKGEEWVYADIPTAYWHQGDAAITAGAQPGGNYAGVYMPQGLTRSNAANYMEPGTMATMGGQPAPARQYKPGDTITGDPATQSRMRRSLYDFNMANYNNPFGPQGNYTPPIPPSFLMGTGGG